MIITYDVSKFFGELCAVNKVNMNVEKGEIFGLIGPDGAGKTTLMRMLCGVLAADEGEIILSGHHISHIEKLRHSIGYMPQRFSLYGDLTVMENIVFFASLYNMDYKTICKRSQELFEFTGILPFQKRLAEQLSGGMKQKLALSCALITKPELLILDEPTYGVDPESRREFWKILYELNEEGMTIMVSTPYMEEAELCHRVAFMNSGRIKLIDHPARLRNSFPYSVMELFCKGGGKIVDLLKGLPSLLDVSVKGGKYRVIASDKEKAAADIKKTFSDINMEYLLKEVRPTMEDIFVMLAEQEANNEVCS